MRSDLAKQKASRIVKQVPAPDSELALLPLFHTADCYDGRSFLENLEIMQTDKCEVFDEKLNYLFYGKPSYKYRTKDKGTRNELFYPVCFVIKISEEDKFDRIYPFDTGAFFHGVYRNYIPEKMDMGDFFLGKSVLDITNFLGALYESNENYYSASPAPKFQHSPLDFEIDAYLKLLNAQGHEDFDDRAAVVEVQLRKPLKLTRDNFIGLIVPKSIRDDYRFDRAKGVLGIKIRTYNVNSWHPSSGFPLIIEAARNLIFNESADAQFDDSVEEG